MGRTKNSVAAYVKQGDGRVAELLVALINSQGNISVDTRDIVVNTEDIENLLKGVGGTARTPGYTRVSDAASVAAGKYKVSFYNIGGSNGTVLTTTLAPNESVTFEVRDADTLGAIAYVATGTTFAITTIE